ncbi:hypothetical protein E4198_16385 [Streptomyces sp. RKND-216]|uniref:hypothetical protein n=1 Tax=Streptomyces sp. RKND-216 TaxID=2562581 RepID=UPI00109E23C3|nr:hypothetical protein [Streptomyces sp. RKND-216]THA26065.1 hypothetical protein E4198_16385 [Streptomyces sp. RKND-216]
MTTIRDAAPATAAEDASSPDDSSSVEPTTSPDAGSSDAPVPPGEVGGAAQVARNPQSRGDALLGRVLATVVTFPLAYICFIVLAIASMGCASCGDAEAARFHDSLELAHAVYQWGLLLPAALLVASWLLPPRRRSAGLRPALAALAPVLVVLLMLAALSLVGAAS